MDNRRDSVSRCAAGILRNEFAMNNLERHVFSRVDSLEKVMSARFDTAREGMLRVEQVIDARLKHLEEH